MIRWCFHRSHFRFSYEANILVLNVLDSAVIGITSLLGYAKIVEVCSLRVSVYVKTHVVLYTKVGTGSVFSPSFSLVCKVE